MTSRSRRNRPTTAANTAGSGATKAFAAARSRTASLFGRGALAALGLWAAVAVPADAAERKASLFRGFAQTMWPAGLSSKQAPPASGISGRTAGAPAESSAPRPPAEEVSAAHSEEGASGLRLAGGKPRAAAPAPQPSGVSQPAGVVTLAAHRQPALGPVPTPAPGRPPVAPPMDVPEPSLGGRKLRSGDEGPCPTPESLKKMSELSDVIAPQTKLLPRECGLGEHVYEGRHWCDVTMTWKASALCHKPLYFEEVALERYGHTRLPYLQPVISGGVFFKNIAMWPYNMGLEPPCECIYVLGYYRPGSCAPYLRYTLPIKPEAVVMEAAFVGGLVWLIP